MPAKRKLTKNEKRRLKKKAEAAARRQVAAVAHSLITTALDTFDEKLGARAGWKAYKEQYMQQAEAAGKDFLAAARYAGNLPAPASSSKDACGCSQSHVSRCRCRQVIPESCHGRW